MSKYDPALLEKAVRLVRQADSYSHGIEAIFDSLERAPWWFPVPAGHRFMDGEPIRFEDGKRSEESTALGLFKAPHKGTFFIDTRWTPPTPPLAVGDVIETVEDLERLPVRAIFTDQNDDAWQHVVQGEFYRTGIERPHSATEVLEYFRSLIVERLPKTEGTE